MLSFLPPVPASSVRPYLSELAHVSIKLTFPSNSYTPSNTFVAGFHFTIALLPGGPSLITHPPIWYKPELVKTEKELDDEELKDLLARNLRPSKKKNKKAGEGEAKAE